MEPTCFETLESLILYTVNRLYVNLLSVRVPESSLRLRVEKPMAISFAEAPVIEVFRTAEQMKDQCKQLGGGSEPKLHIVKPYPI